MNTSPSEPDRIVRAAAWLYVLPRAARGLIILSTVGLAAFMVFGAVALSFLHRFAN